MPTDQELELASRFILYELQNLLYMRRANPAAEKRQSIGSDQYERHLWHTCNTATLEAFLLHYRNLRDFLNNKGNDNSKHPDDVLALHYAPTIWASTGYVAPIAADEEKRLNKLLAHISYRRRELKPGDWPLTEMLENICAVMERFIAAVPRERRHWFDSCSAELSNRERPGSSVAMLGGNSTASVSMWPWSLIDTELIFKK